MIYAISFFPAIIKDLISHYASAKSVPYLCFAQFYWHKGRTQWRFRHVEINSVEKHMYLHSCYATPANISILHFCILLPSLPECSTFFWKVPFYCSSSLSRKLFSASHYWWQAFSFTTYTCFILSINILPCISASQLTAAEALLLQTDIKCLPRFPHISSPLWSDVRKAGSTICKIVK